MSNSIFAVLRAAPGSARVLRARGEELAAREVQAHVALCGGEDVAKETAHSTAASVGM